MTDSSLVTHNVVGSHLIVEGSDLNSVLPQREQRLVLVVRACVHREHVGAGQRRRKDPRLGVHSLPQVCVTLCKRIPIKLVQTVGDIGVYCYSRNDYQIDSLH